MRHPAEFEITLAAERTLERALWATQFLALTALAVWLWTGAGAGHWGPGVWSVMALAVGVLGVPGCPTGLAQGWHLRFDGRTWHWQSLGSGRRWLRIGLGLAPWPVRRSPDPPIFGSGELRCRLQVGAWCLLQARALEGGRSAWISVRIDRLGAAGPLLRTVEAWS